jgi:hypothetical protein
MEVGKRLVQLCKEFKNLDAIKELYSDDIVSHEAVEMPGHPKTLKGKDAILKKTEWWVANHTIHSATTTGPWPNGDRFVVIFDYDVTPPSGPMANKRMKMVEAALYTVKDGMITQEEFFYDMGG